MKESELQTKVTRFFKSRRAKELMRDRGWNCVAAELKIARGERIPFSGIAEHQVMSLLMASGSGGMRPLVHKISDSGVGYKPFDMFVLSDACGWFVLGFRDGERVLVVDCEDVEYIMFDEDGTRKRGSVTLAWAEEHAIWDLTNELYNGGKSK